VDTCGFHLGGPDTSGPLLLFIKFLLMLSLTIAWFVHRANTDKASNSMEVLAYLRILTNPCLDGWVKIGMTARNDITARLA